MLPEGVNIPDDDAIQADMTSPRIKPQLTNDFLLESKDDMKRRGVRSPDLADAMALTFAFNEWLTNYTEETKVTPFGNLEVAPRVQPFTDVLLPPTPTGWMG
jgi:hypothetical protein